MLIKLVEESSDAVVPQLNQSVVQTRKHPRALGVKIQALDSLGVCF